MTQSGCHFSGLGPELPPEHLLPGLGKEEQLQSLPPGRDEVITRGSFSASAQELVALTLPLEDPLCLQLSRARKPALGISWVLTRCQALF